VLYETFRSFADTRTEAAWPYIARLTAQTIRRGGVDTFFRRAARLLERCEHDDLERLVAATRWAAHALTVHPSEQDLVAVCFVVRGDKLAALVHYRMPEDGSAAARHHDHGPITGRNDPRGFDLIQLVIDSRLARQAGQMEQPEARFELAEEYFQRLSQLPR
jgi:hypothetical protein